jgi:photosystem II stability/assembly factor-like uncharacterized protein
MAGLKLLVGTRQGLWTLEGVPGKFRKPESISPAEWYITDVEVLADGAAVIGRMGEEALVWNGTWKPLLLPEVTAWGYLPEVPELIWAGSVPAAMWVSRDGGFTWEESSSVYEIKDYESWWVPTPPHHPAVLSISFSPRRPEVVFASVEGGGVIRTRNGGRRWLRLEGGIFDTVYTIIAHPRVPGVVFAASATGFFRSEDGGMYWERAIEGMRRLHLQPAVLIPGRDRSEDVLLTAGAIAGEEFWGQPEGARAVVYKSTDWGDYWYPVAKGIGIELQEMVTELCYCNGFVVAASSKGTVWISQDAGENWEKVAEGLPFVTSIDALE